MKIMEAIRANSSHALWSCSRALAISLFSTAVAAVQIDIAGPPGSGAFGATVTLLPNGNFVVTDPKFDAPGPIVDVGAVYLYRADGSLVSVLQGTSTGDQIGLNGITVLHNGNYVIHSVRWDNGTQVDAGATTWGHRDTGVSGVVGADNSLVSAYPGLGTVRFLVMPLRNGHYLVINPEWDSGSASNVGAVTWGNGNTGTSGIISASNSLIGSRDGDYVGTFGAVELSNGNYVVSSSEWDNGDVIDVGAVTWGDGSAGVSGLVGFDNSLLGSKTEDRVGSGGVTALSNGHYVVASSSWDNGQQTNSGAITWGDGASGTRGVVGLSNSLVGGQSGDNVGSFTRFRSVTSLGNGHYVVVSPRWSSANRRGVGAVTWANGSAAITGLISSANSLVGSQTNDSVGSHGVTVLSSGNYVVASAQWSNGEQFNAGAVTWGSGQSGVSGVISISNSLVGTKVNDAVGGDQFFRPCVTALSNGHYVVRSYSWSDAGKQDVGAVTWGNGYSGITGVINSSNSYVGAQRGDMVGFGGLTALLNGHYVFASIGWRRGDISVGAVTWGNGDIGSSGVVGVDNSLIGSQAGDRLGEGGIIALRNGNYVVVSPYWDNGSVADASAVTWANGAAGTSGVVGPDNSLVGDQQFDYPSIGGVLALANGHYAVSYPKWHSIDAVNAGAVVWGDGAIGTRGSISASNALFGAQVDDQVGSGGITALSNGDYVIRSPQWHNGDITNAGAISLADGTGSTIGILTSFNSVLGSDSTADAMVFAYDELRAQLVVGRPASNLVSLFRRTAADTLFLNGFE